MEPLPGPAPIEVSVESVAAAEDAVAGGVIAGAEKRLLWHGSGPAEPTPYAVVYLHGFSATRQETAPLAELVAAGLEANLFETRLAGHGIAESPLEDVTAEDWLIDAAEALAIGQRIGERIVLIGASTGATLAVAAAGFEAFEAVTALVFLSPNFGPADPASELLLYPGGGLLARALVGDYREWQPANERQARYWTTRYPTRTLTEMMRLVGLARSRLPLDVDAALLAVLSPGDRVIDVAKARGALDRIRAPRVRVVEFAADTDPGSHIMAGDILAPGQTAALADLIVRFVRGDEL